MGDGVHFWDPARERNLKLRTPLGNEITNHQPTYLWNYSFISFAFCLYKIFRLTRYFHMSDHHLAKGLSLYWSTTLEFPPSYRSWYRKFVSFFKLRIKLKSVKTHLKNGSLHLALFYLPSMNCPYLALEIWICFEHLHTTAVPQPLWSWVSSLESSCLFLPSYS